jgi:hypothetical protein
MISEQHSVKAYHITAINLLADGQWEASHACIQAYDDALSCRIHGLLHRIEGDLPNAAYWYRRAGMTMPVDDSDVELSELKASVHDRPDRQ